MPQPEVRKHLRLEVTWVMDETAEKKGWGGAVALTVSNILEAYYVPGIASIEVAESL